MSTLTPEQLRAMTPEQKEELAASMISPVKCGGCDYDPDGSRFYWTGGRRIPEAEFQALSMSQKRRMTLANERK